jgi:hypothetical protein
MVTSQPEVRQDKNVQTTHDCKASKPKARLEIEIPTSPDKEPNHDLPSSPPSTQPATS